MSSRRSPHREDSRPWRGPSAARLRRRVVTALVLVTAAPLLARALWAAGDGQKASDAQNVAWFATVALAVLVAGCLVPTRWWPIAATSVVAVVSTIATLCWWWSSQDTSGLFVVGVVLAVPPVALAAPLLLIAGGRLGRPSSGLLRVCRRVRGRIGS